MTSANQPMTYPTKLLLRLSVNQRMWIIIALVVSLGAGLIYLSHLTVSHATALSIRTGGEISEQAQFDRIQLATETLAHSLGVRLEQVSDPIQKRRMVTDAVRDLRFDQDQSGYFFAYVGTEVVTVPIKPELVGQDLGQAKDVNGVYYVRELVERAKEGGGFVEYVFAKEGQGDTPKVGYATMIPNSPFMLGTGVYLDNVDTIKEQISTSLRTSLMASTIRFWIFGILFVLITVGTVLLIKRAIIRPVRILSEGLSEIARGDLSVRVDYASRDEIGQLANVANAMAEALENKASLATRIGEGNLEQEVRLSSGKDALGLALEMMVRKLRETVGNVVASANYVAAGSGEIS